VLYPLGPPFGLLLVPFPRCVDLHPLSNRAASLLQDVRHLVSQQAPASGRRGLILGAAEEDVGPDRIGVGGELVRRLGSLLVGMDAHLAEIRPEPRLHE
jgi:hypothetical protein